MKKGIKYWIAGIAFVVAAGVFVAAQNPDFKLGRSMEMLVNMMRELNYFYVDEVDSDKLLENAAAGMTADLDPYTEYISPKQMEEFEMMTTGKYGGIGSLIRKKGDYIQIAQPYKDSPADKAGLQIGDKIVAVEGKDAKGWAAEQVSSQLKGDPGTTIKLTVEKFFTGKQETLSIKRERITIPGVPYYGFVNDSTGYIQHSDFTEDCSSDMRAAVMTMHDTGRLKGLILDYRGNGGGIMQEAVKILSMFVPKGTEVVSIKGKTMEAPVAFKTESEPILPDIPIVILTNSGSASAAEIFAGAMQDLDRGVLVGQRTFGKGLVQATRPVGYNAYLKVTTAKYYIPSGRCIQAIDYEHRNEDGSVGTVPDSLINEFHTAAGRKVYDGGGVMPDVVIPADYVSRFTLMAYGRGYIEDFVDEWIKRHPEPVDVDNFRLSDADYAEFVGFMTGKKDVEYVSETRVALDLLKARAERELYYDSVKESIEKMEKELGDDVGSNLMLYKSQLTDLIENDIVLRFHYAAGVVRHSLHRDKDVWQAETLLADGKRYKEILASQDTARK